jgi:hypothetical protein
MPRTPAQLTVVRIVGEGWHVRKGDSIVAVFYLEADARAFVALPALRQALENIAARGICDDNPKACYLASGPYCGEHVYDEDMVKEARAALAQADGPAPTEAVCTGVHHRDRFDETDHCWRCACGAWMPSP